MILFFDSVQELESLVLVKYVLCDAKVNDCVVVHVMKAERLVVESHLDAVRLDNLGQDLSQNLVVVAGELRKLDQRFLVSYYSHKEDFVVRSSHRTVACARTLL